MSDEGLQTGELSQENQAASAENQPAEQLSQQAGAELATDTEGQQEKTAQVDEAAAKAAAATQKVINEKHFQTKQAERERDDALAQIATFEQEKRDAEAARAGDIPPIPEEFDDNFKEKMVERDAAIARQATFQASQANYNQQLENQQALAQQQAQAERQQKVVSYNAKAVEFGINEAELRAAENAVMSYGLSDDTSAHIMADSDGPLIVKHLAANPADTMTLVNMSPFQQGAFLDHIKAKASALKPKQTQTPNPPEILTGGGAQVDVDKYPNSAGATFS